MCKSITIALAGSILMALSACGVGNGTPEGCATALYGTFTGMPEGDGMVNAWMYLNDREDTPDVVEYTIDITFLEPDDTPDDATDNSIRTTEVAVMEDGTLVSIPAVALQLPNSSMDFDTCKATGEWDLFAGNEVGTWEIGRYEPLGF